MNTSVLSGSTNGYNASKKSYARLQGQQMFLSPQNKTYQSKLSNLIQNELIAVNMRNLKHFQDTEISKDNLKTEKSLDHFRLSEQDNRTFQQQNRIVETPQLSSTQTHQKTLSTYDFNKQRLSQSSSKCSSVKAKSIHVKAQSNIPKNLVDSFQYADVLLSGTEEFEGDTIKGYNQEINNIIKEINESSTKLGKRKGKDYLTNPRNSQQNIQLCPYQDIDLSSNCSDFQTSLHTLRDNFIPHLLSNINEKKQEENGGQLMDNNKRIFSKRGSQATSATYRSGSRDKDETRSKISLFVQQDPAIMKKCRSPNRSDTMAQIIEKMYQDQALLLQSETVQINKIQKQRQQNQRKLKENQQEITNLLTVQKTLVQKIDIQEHKNFQLQEYLNNLRPQILQFKQNLEETKQKVDKDMYDLTLKRQRIRTYVQSLQRDNMQQREDFDLLIDEENEKIKIAMSVCEESMMVKKRLEQQLRRAHVSEKEKERDLSQKRARLQKQINTAMICAQVDLSRVGDRSQNEGLNTSSNKRLTPSKSNKSNLSGYHRKELSNLSPSRSFDSGNSYEGFSGTSAMYNNRGGYETCKAASKKINL
ncbi:UNKNOWN [Stylonychia lemnae]|uniref:Uncharacterized protein n=1 Tax=Stylonychia lemnae TaxID=5949 RepID=A0A078B6S5_STYLE|nr:UNKNOWN [Stylonychia lemnae]|eukprot:CDW89268.1 UNKNOWN [Stylonychia lemnae]